MAQDDYRIDTDSPAAQDLMFWTVVGHEALSQPSTYELRVLSKRDGEWGPFEPIPASVFGILP